MIGAGAAGLAAARAAGGKRVAIVEKARPGGDCTFTGCVPSKTLLAVAARAVALRDSEPFGLKGDVQVDLTSVLQYVRSVVEEIARDETPGVLQREGIEFFEGTARFVDTSTVDIGARKLVAEKIVLAVGSRPTIPDLPGADSAEILTNETIFQIRKPIERLIVLGGGPVGCELAQAFARLGVDVVLVEAGERILDREEPEVSAVISEALSADGVRIMTRAEAKGFGSGATVRLGDNEELHGSHVLVATGRTPDVSDLRLDMAGVEMTDGHRIKVDARGRTSQPHIYAVGDCADELRFTHVADEQGRVAVRHARSRFRGKFDRRAIPWVTFTDPEVGRVGLTEEQAFEEFGDSARVAVMPVEDTDRGRCSGRRAGFIKLIAAPRPVLRSLGGGRLVGMTAVSQAGGELIAEATLAMRTGMFAGRLAQTIHAYPTWSVAVRQAAAQWFTNHDRPARSHNGS